MTTISYKKKETDKYTLFLELVTGQGTVEINYPIEAQTMTLKCTKISFKTTQDAIDNAKMFVKIPALGPQQFNNNLGQSMIPIMGDVDHKDWINLPNIKFSLSKPIPRKFSYQICDSNGTILMDNKFNFVNLWFEYATI